MGVLIMSGFIVGESLFNVALAGLIVSTGTGEPLAITNSLSESQAMIIATALGAAVVASLYRWAATTRGASKHKASGPVRRAPLHLG